jgi:hypothetical protein
MIELDTEEEFIRWLSKGFKYETIVEQEGASRLYYTFVKQGERRGFYKLPGFTKAGAYRLRDKLFDDGWIYKVSERAGPKVKKPSTFLVPLHPYPLIKWISAHETYTDMMTLRERFGEIIDDLTSTWQENFGVLFQKEECFFPAVGRVGWKNYIAYGNVFGWILSSELQLKKVILLTPHLKLLKDPAFKEIILELAKLRQIEFEFIAFEKEVDNSIKALLSTSNLIKIWALSPDNKNIHVNLHSERGIVLIDKGGEPFLGFEAKKIEESGSYVGAVHVRCREGHVQNILNALENLKGIAKKLS